MKRNIGFALFLAFLLLITYGCEESHLPSPPAQGSQDCLAGITNYTSDGPFRYDVERDGDVNMWVPRVPDGCKVPVIHLANGTGGNCRTNYGDILEHLASHGFLATCYEDTNTGAGYQCIDAVGTVIENYPDMASNLIGFTGHSQGGGAAFICTLHAEQDWGNAGTIAGHAIEPASGYGDGPSNWADLYEDITSPMFMFNGSNDSLVSASWVRRAFNALDSNVEAYWYEAQGATHIPIPTDWSIESATAWFRWKLLGDSAACRYFKNMPNSRDWRMQDSQNEMSCN